MGGKKENEHFSKAMINISREDIISVKWQQDTSKTENKKEKLKNKNEMLMLRNLKDKMRKVKELYPVEWRELPKFQSLCILYKTTPNPGPLYN